MRIRPLLSVSRWFLRKRVSLGYRFPALRLGVRPKYVLDHDFLEVLDTPNWLRLNCTYDLSFHIDFDHSMSVREFYQTNTVSPAIDHLWLQ